MSGVVPTLRELHRLRRHARDLQTEIDRGPRVLKAHQQKLAKQEADYRDAQEGLKKLKMSVHEKEVSLKATHQQLDKFKKQLDTAQSQKEFGLKQVEINTAQERLRQLEEEIFAGMAETDERTAKLPELEQALRQAKEDYAKFEQEANARVARLSEELRLAQESIRAAEATLPATVAAQYQKLVAAFGVDALAAAKDQTCTHCRTGITSQQWHNLQSGQFVTCKSCSRGLYLAG